MKRAAAASSSSREVSAAPVFVCRTWPSSDMSKTSPSFPDPVYEPRISSMARVAAVSAVQAPTTTCCTGLLPAPRRQHPSTNAAPPTSSAKPAYET